MDVYIHKFILNITEHILIFDWKLNNDHSPLSTMLVYIGKMWCFQVCFGWEQWGNIPVRLPTFRGWGEMLFF